MIKKVLVVSILGFILGGFLNAQIGQVVRDTIWLENDVNKPIEFSKATGKYVYIKNIIPSDIPPKSRKITIISSISNELDTKQVQVVEDKHIIMPLSLFTEKYYTLYIWKGNATILAKKLIIR